MVSKWPGDSLSHLPDPLHEKLPDYDYKLSPYTGWTRAHWEHMLARATYGYVLAGERNGSPARALFPDDRCDRPDAVDALEAFSRIALLWGARLRNPANPATVVYQGREIDVAALMREALLQGTDPTNPYTYWGDIVDMDQRIVESSNLSLALLLSRERVFETMTAPERAQIIAWLAQVDGKKTWPDNWILFPAFSQFVRLQLGYAAPEADLNARLDLMRTLYRGDGWYGDGAGDKFDLYNAWMFGTHYLLWAWLDGERRPDLRQEVLERARIFLSCFPYFFGANGSYVAWGRSIAGRFAAVATFGIGYALGIAPPNPGLVRRVSSGCLRYFYDHGAFDSEAHYLYQGYHGNFPPAGESYASSGSPYSAFHGLLALTLDPEDPFWTATEAPLPVEREDFERAFLVPGFVLAGKKETGQVLLLNSRSSHESDTIRNDYIPKYGKFVYSTHLPFNVMPVDGSYTPDSMIALTHDGKTFGHREATRRGGVGPGIMWCEFEEIVDSQPHTLKVAVLLWRDLQIRIALVEPSAPVRALEAPGALGCNGASCISRRSDPVGGWEYACAQEPASTESRAVGIRRLWGYDAQTPSRPFMGYSNLNLAHKYVEQPIVYETQLSAQPRILGSLALVRSAPFDPQREFEGVTLLPEAAGTVRVSYQEGGEAMVALGEPVRNRVKVGGIRVEGELLRYARIQSAGAQVCGIGLTEIEGIARLSSPGTLSLRRAGDGVSFVSTNVGVSLAPAWLQGTIDRLEVRTGDEEWVDAGEPEVANAISADRVAEWAYRTGLEFVDFRFRSVNG